MARYALGVTYNGGQFHGWQRQRGVPTVQGALENALNQVANHTVELSVAGRTDKGVHACGQVAAFTSLSERTPYQWRRAMNSLTPTDISVDWVVPVNDDFHPRFAATARRYLYLFATEPQANPLVDPFVWRCPKLDTHCMHVAAQALLGEQDFTSFRAAGCQSNTPWRRIHHANVLRHGPWIILDIEANAFLLHMVRNIARGLVEASHSGDEDFIGRLLAMKDRTRLGPTAPPQGLYLYAVSYPNANFATPSLPPLLADMAEF